MTVKLCVKCGEEISDKALANPIMYPYFHLCLKCRHHWKRFKNSNRIIDYEIRTPLVKND